jgi:hypothetical protein
VTQHEGEFIHRAEHPAIARFSIHEELHLSDFVNERGARDVKRVQQSVSTR